jgi:hypothetical protein
VLFVLLINLYFFLHLLYFLWRSKNFSLYPIYWHALALYSALGSDKTKKQEDPGNKGGYQRTNRSEREQGQRGLEQQQGKSKNDDNDDNEDVNWKVVHGRKSGTSLRKAYTKGSDDAT